MVSDACDEGPGGARGAGAQGPVGVPGRGELGASGCAVLAGFHPVSPALTQTSESQHCADSVRGGRTPGLVSWIISSSRRVSSVSELSLGSGSISFSKFIFLHKSFWLLWD